MKELPGLLGKAGNSRFTLAWMAALLFAALWFTEILKRPPVVVKEVLKPFEVVKPMTVEVLQPAEPAMPKEVVKEVPAALTEAQQAALDIASNYLYAPNLSGIDDALQNIDSFCVRVKMREDVRKSVSEELIKEKCEAVLKKNGLRLDEQSPHLLGINYDGFWDEAQTTLTFGLFMELYDSVTIARDLDMHRTVAIVWAHNCLGTVSKEAAQEALLNNVETNTVFFARKYQAAQTVAK